ncbi:hypothetical protein [Streptomyces sp. IMTB 2501]|nr:hypothetical protein [Streptomyces sp. IMTB 2501]
MPITTGINFQSMGADRDVINGDFVAAVTTDLRQSPPPAAVDPAHLR